MAQNHYLHHVNVIAKCLESHFKHDLLRQVACTLKDHIALQRSKLIVARELCGVHNGPNLITLNGILKLMSQPVEKNSRVIVTELE